MIEPGKMYVATPDHHLMVEHEKVIVKRGAKENRFRPSIEILFRSAAYTYGSLVIRVVLLGVLDDGLEETTMPLTRPGQHFNKNAQGDIAQLFHRKAQSIKAHSQAVHDSVLAHELICGDMGLKSEIMGN